MSLAFYADKMSKVLESKFQVSELVADVPEIISEVVEKITDVDILKSPKQIKSRDSQIAELSSFLEKIESPIIGALSPLAKTLSGINLIQDSEYNEDKQKQDSNRILYDIVNEMFPQYDPIIIHVEVNDDVIEMIREKGYTILGYTKVSIIFAS